INTFQVNEVNCFNYAYVIPLVVIKAWLEEGSYIMTEIQGEKLPELMMKSGA
ncbi:hypothetical protein V8B97DRAFT_1845228, partial [Scleroderma yunnanense]